MVLIFPTPEVVPNSVSQTEGKPSPLIYFKSNTFWSRSEASQPTTIHYSHQFHSNQSFFFRNFLVFRISIINNNNRPFYLFFIFVVFCFLPFFLVLHPSILSIDLNKLWRLPNQLYAVIP